MANVRMALIFSSGSIYLYQFLNLLFQMYVARVLTPEEIGTFAIVAAITMSSGAFRLLGTGDYLIREELNTDKVKNALGLSLISSWLIAATITLSADVIANFYQKSDIKYLLYALSVQFWLGPFISINFALLQKEFQYIHNASITWSANFANFASSLIFLYYDYSYFALAYGIAIGNLVEFVLTLFWHSKSMCFAPKFTNLKPILKFGTINTATNLVMQQSKLSYDIVIGKIGSTTDVAFFSRAHGLVDFVGHTILGGLQSIALPYLSMQKDDIKQAYLNASSLTLAVLVPVVACAGILAYELIFVLFGKQWGSASHLVPYIALWYLLTNLHPFARHLLLAKGYEKEFFYSQLFIFVLIVANIFFSYQYGLKAIAIGLVAIGFISVIILALLVKKAVQLPVTSYLLYMAPCLVITLVCALSAYFIREFTANAYSETMTIVVAAVLLPIIWLSSVKLVKHPIYDECKKVILKLKPA